MENILQKIVTRKREEVAEQKQLHPAESMLREAESCTRQSLSMATALRQSPTGIIAEFKRRSPSKGWINQSADPQIVVPGYAQAGASACSVLTDGTFFGGSLADLVVARTVAPQLPLLRKEFVIDPYQLHQARLAGADAVLLIAACLSVQECAELAAEAHRMHLEVLLEIHSEEELAHLNPHVDMLGVNNRNLATFETDVQLSLTLAAEIKRRTDDVVLISESGLSQAETLLRLRQAGFRGFLMGESFMKTAHPAAELSTLITQLC